VEDRFGKMSIKELEELRRDAQKELDTREKQRKQQVLLREEAEADAILAKIDVLLSICEHTEHNKCYDDHLKEDAYTDYENENNVKCIRCYLLSCKQYAMPPKFKISLQFEQYEVFGRYA